ncbi:hypothetical protein DESC_500180 [Desulfosarcina cetonica]|nr:hypothetical protein DESC_500180 [Desulfosarcina cetonica]
MNFGCQLELSQILNFLKSGNINIYMQIPNRTLLEYISLNSKTHLLKDCLDEFKFGTIRQAGKKWESAGTRRGCLRYSRENLRFGIADAGSPRRCRR